jgi:hypothetical protein
LRWKNLSEIALEIALEKLQVFALEKLLTKF